MATESEPVTPASAQPPEATNGSIGGDERELAELVELLQALIRLRTVNPPGDEILAARYLHDVLDAAGIPSTVVEPFPGRGSIVARLRGDGTGGDPLLLLSHLDVVPADPAGWSHDPFGGEVDRGYVWGRGAVDMKSMVAMEVQVLRALAARARAAGRDPASDPVPGLRRDVIFCSAADEEAGGWQGANWLVNEHPDWLRAAGALNEAGGVRMQWSGLSVYPIQVAEKGFVVYRLHVRGRWGHGSIPTADNAAVLAARIVTKLAEPLPMRMTPAVAGALATILPMLPARMMQTVMSLGSATPADFDAGLRTLCDPALARAAAALTRDTVSPDVIHAGVKYNVIPGTAEIELDCRTLPGTTEESLRAALRELVGDELWSHVDVEVEQVGPAVEAPTEGSALYSLLCSVLRDHDPYALPVPALAPYATDAKHLSRIGVPVYGFTPLRFTRDDNFLALMHGDDERVSIDALRFGLPVLTEAVLRFCGE